MSRTILRCMFFAGLLLITPLLAGCSDSDSNESRKRYDEQIEEAVEEFNNFNEFAFDPGARVIPFPNDIAWTHRTDAQGNGLVTLDPGADADPAVAALYTAVNILNLKGLSPNTPMGIPLAKDIPLDPNTFEHNIKLIDLNTLVGVIYTFLTQAGLEVSPSMNGAVTGLMQLDANGLSQLKAMLAQEPYNSMIRETALTFGQVDKTLKIYPLMPLNPDTKYLVVIEEGIGDINGKHVEAPQYYLALESKEPLTGDFAALEELRQGYLPLYDAILPALGITREEALMIFTFTTADKTLSTADFAVIEDAATRLAMGEAVDLNAMPIEGLSYENIKTEYQNIGAATDAMIALMDMLNTMGVAMPYVNGPTFTSFDITTLARLQVPPMSEMLASLSDPSVQQALGTYVQLSQSQDQQILGILQLIMNPADPGNAQIIQLLSASENPEILGILHILNEPEDPGNYGIIQMLTASENPEIATMAGLLAALSDSALSAKLTRILDTMTLLQDPANQAAMLPTPLPVPFVVFNGGNYNSTALIFQHGLGGNKTHGTLLQMDYPVICMDLPAHGERVLDADNPYTSCDETASGSCYLTENFPQDRINFYQTYFDQTMLLKHLRMGRFDINGDSAPDAPQTVYFVGQSMGSITGSVFTAQNADTAFAPEKAVLSVGGANFSAIVDTASNAEIVRLYQMLGLTKNTTDYLVTFGVLQTLLDPADPVYLAQGNIPSRVMIHSAYKDTLVSNVATDIQSYVIGHAATTWIRDFTGFNPYAYNNAGPGRYMFGGMEGKTDNWVGHGFLLNPYITHPETNQIYYPEAQGYLDPEYLMAAYLSANELMNVFLSAP